MYPKLIKWAYFKFIRKYLEEYVNSTENEWDDKALEFLDEIIELIALKLKNTGALKAEIEKAIDLDMA